MPRSGRRRLGCWLTVAALAIAAWLGWNWLQRMMREQPERFPWTELSLRDPIGPFTGRKLARLTSDPSRCRALIADAGQSDTPVPPRRPGQAQCGFDDGMLLRPEGDRSIAYAPAGLITSCPVAAALSLWERDVVQPAAERNFGTRVVRIAHAGSFSCRRLYGRAEGRFSEHATADAVDILGFRLGDGRSISVLRDWRGGGADAAFLREVRDGSCDLFSTVLSPDYNAAHSDHFHLDQAERGATSWRLCR